MTKIFGNGKFCSDRKRWQWKKVTIESLAMENFVAIEKGSHRKWS
jgi:hypothetical protein